ncbi:RNA demethylase ALKBH9B-like [Lolium rigidum]|uniref:RNA demethylase ALKBH9B-like n=1 Tax=Lolium rigidum TaxID=89674 RepID=UPI001F5C5811|nr:RNA demethylase ALKBH9B-like [Lolium rigidum]
MAAANADDDPMALVRGQYDADELAIAGEFLTTWLPFLSAGLCPSCAGSLRGRVESLLPRADDSPPEPRVDQIEPSGWDLDPAPPQHLPFEASGWDSDPPPPQQQQPAETPRMSWADMAQEDELAAAAEEDAAATPADDGEEAGKPRAKPSREQRELHRFRKVARKDDFICFERVKGRLVNILAGLELHAGVFSAAEQQRIVECVYDLQEKGKRGELGDRTYTEPEKWMRGKGRVTIQFGCCYNYATDKNGNPPGIIQTFVSDPIPELFKVMIKRLVKWRILPPDCVPDSCIVNMYDPGDCIPPHIDSHDFVRPFCTVSFLSECNILFGSSLKIAGPGEFVGSFAIPLPVGSVLIINGNGADVAKHCVPAVPSKRISITFRKMDPAKRPFSFKDDPDLLNITPLEAAPQETSRAAPQESNRAAPQESSRSSDDGKGKQLDVPNGNLGSRSSRSRKSKGRTSAGKPSWGGILGDQPPQRPQSPMTSTSSDRERDSIGRLREPRYPQSSDRERDSIGRSREAGYLPSSERGRDSIGRPTETGYSPSSERERDSIARSREPRYPPSSGRESNSIGRSREPRYPRDAPGMQSHGEDLRDRLNRLPHERAYGSGVYFINNGAESQERKQRMEHRQLLMINRTINDEMDSLSTGSHDSPDQPRMSIRTIHNKPRTRINMGG